MHQAQVHFQNKSLQALNRGTSEMQIDKKPLFLCHRPDWAEGIAAPLMHPVFGEFLDGARDPSLPTRRDSHFAAEFSHAALLAYPNEKSRQDILVSFKWWYCRLALELKAEEIKYSPPLSSILFVSCSWPSGCNLTHLPSVYANKHFHALLHSLPPLSCIHSP